jgi:hypothetical protein
MYKLKSKLVQHKGRKKILIICAAVVLVLGGALAALESTDKTHFLHNSSNKNLETQKSSNTRTAGQNTKGETEGDNTSTASSDDKGTTADTSTPEDNKSDTGSTTVDPTTPLTTPNGNFISNHSPNLSGSPHPNTIQSVCNTTPGATCTIVFTKGGVTRQLPAQTTDKGGAAYWTWKLQDIGLTQGSWTVTAKATLGSQTKTASDVTNLEVGS